MRSVLGVLLLAAAVARADDVREERPATVEGAVRAFLDTFTDEDLASTQPAGEAMAGKGEGVRLPAIGNLFPESTPKHEPTLDDFLKMRLTGVDAVPEPPPRISAAADAAATTSPWDISAALGFTLTSGNSDSITLTVGAKATREWALWKLGMKLGILYAESEDVQTASEWLFMERLERKLSERATIFQDLLLEHDEEEDLAYRVQFTLGYNRRLVKKDETFVLWGNVGGGVLYERFFDETQTEAIAQIGIDFVWQITKLLKYTQVITFYPSLSESGEYRVYWESVFTTPLSERLDLRLSIIDRYDSDPQPGVENNDLTVALSIAIRFTKPPPPPP